MGGLARTTEQKVGANRIRSARGGDSARSCSAPGITAREIERAAGEGRADPRAPRRLSGRARRPEHEATYLAAVFACGEGTLLCGRAAAHLLAPDQGTPPPPEVICPTQRRIRGVKTHRSRNGRPRDATDSPRHPRDHRPPHPRRPRRRPRPRTTSPAPATRPGSATARLRPRSRPSSPAARTAPGAAKLRRVMRGDVHVTLSGLERRFLALLRDAGLPLPADQPPRRRPPRRLPLARAPPDRRARQLPLPLLAPRLGAGPPPRARGARPRRRLPPLHLRRRLRAPAPDARRAARPSHGRTPRPSHALIEQFEAPDPHIGSPRGRLDLLGACCSRWRSR